MNICDVGNFLDQSSFGNFGDFAHLQISFHVANMTEILAEFFRSAQGSKIDFDQNL